VRKKPFTGMAGGYQLLWIMTVIDSDGFRPNVGIILTNNAGQLLWARRVGGQDAWQFPQGGINKTESPEEALFRELHEEVGLFPNDVQILGATRGWLRYRLPDRLVRHNSQPLCIGQKQRWFLLKLLADDNQVVLNNNVDKPEFDEWRWVSYWYPLGKVVAFKRDVYRRALKELSLVHSQHVSANLHLVESE
jgi:putative (di)nucleoside polyphosphate hydrolase